MKPMSEVVSVAKRVMLTRDGNVLIEHLMDKFYHQNIKNETMARQIGQRDVLTYIKRLVEGAHET